MQWTSALGRTSGALVEQFVNVSASGLSALLAY